MFVPGENIMENKMTYGYVTRHQAMTLYKLDLSSRKFVSTIDLQRYDCVPTKVTFLALGT